MRGLNKFSNVPALVSLWEEHILSVLTTNPLIVGRQRVHNNRVIFTRADRDKPG